MININQYNAHICDFGFSKHNFTTVAMAMFLHYSLHTCIIHNYYYKHNDDLYNYNYTSTTNIGIVP